MTQENWQLWKSPGAENVPSVPRLPGWNPEAGKLVVIGHGDCPDGLQQLKEAVAVRFPDAEVITADIGPIIGAHTGPGMLALIYWGNNR